MAHHVTAEAIANNLNKSNSDTPFQQSTNLQDYSMYIATYIELQSVMLQHM